MSTSRVTAPDVRVEQSSSTLTIRDLSIPGHLLQLRLLDPETLRGRIRAFANDAEHLVPSDLEVGPEEALSFLSSMKEKAYNCLADCTSDEEQLQAAVEIFSRGINAAWLRCSPLQVEVFELDAEYLPWEWLGGRDRQTDYRAEARSLLGFTAEVYRRDGLENQTGRSTFLTAQPLQVRFFRHPGLRGTNREENFFRFSGGVFRLLGPLPEPGGGLALVEPLADPLYSAREGPDQVVHLSCETRSASLDSTLSFGPGFAIKVTDLEGRLKDAAKAPGTVERPLVFFNGCSGDFYPFTARSLARVLLHNGNRAVVSTSIPAPDDVAAAFGQLFYKRLLGGQQTSASAFLWAKRDLLHRHRSPLGLLYTYYGQPALRVTSAADIPPGWRSPAPMEGWCA